MKRRVTQVTKITKTADNRLQNLEEKLLRIEDLLSSLEKLLPAREPAENAPKSTTFTYTITKKS